MKVEYYIPPSSFLPAVQPPHRRETICRRSYQPKIRAGGSRPPCGNVGSLPSVQPDGKCPIDIGILESNRTSRSGGGALAYRNGTLRA